MQSINCVLDTHKATELHRNRRAQAGLKREGKALTAQIVACGSTRHRIRESLDAHEARDAVVLGLAAHASGHTDATVRSRVERYRAGADFSPGELLATSAAMECDLMGKNPVVLPMDSNTCRLCGPAFPLRRLAVEALLACDTCGYSEPYIDSNLNAHGHDKIESTSFSYKRSNHFIEWLNAAQGREHTTIPDVVLEDCCRQIRLEKIPMGRVNPKTVRRILKVTGHRKFYENVNLLCYKLTGVPPMRFTASQEEALKAMFLSIQEPFETVRRKYMPSRRNFLSYSFCLYKFCELLGLDQFLGSFALLKGRDKLHKQDIIFEHICKILDWEFYPSV